MKLLLLLLILCPAVTAWIPRKDPTREKGCTYLQSSSLETNHLLGTDSYTPVFHFSRPEALEMMGRLDDAIMGGISTSSLAFSSDGFTRWGGVCRTDGGGFCGFRSNPFRQPLQVADADGFYLIGRLASDLEPERRVWKFSTRTKPDRGEVVYQAPFSFPKNQSAWHRVNIPFDDFCLVRGPRIVPNGPLLNTTGGIYQVGMTMSKFVFGTNTTELTDFRDGFFEVQLKEIGLYKRQQQLSKNELIIKSPQVLSESEFKKQQPLILKLMVPLFRLLFSESSRRRKSAMRHLRERRGLSRGRAIWLGYAIEPKALALSDP
ncbi:hypothetical protein FisN_5Lh315 [Fistulifera solaris]|uniref:NADH:ubiquinone oxidoreductase intermediate-associated protein 30 domain-containing protein n=1 Tax=Fistulifera solaris TaxID=1519565 RepID=A0A1Z5KG13_FISSO|nr:hypothetical protein FisN_5Lh315 [Fistulifera solaris]|eukprot:GAX25233.1 hypothetical protein FisN_5Lh315 [Fistulifera solaris]